MLLAEKILPRSFVAGKHCTFLCAEYNKAPLYNAFTTVEIESPYG